MDHSPFSAAFTSGTRLAQPGGPPIEMEVREIGQLALPTGRIVVADPFITDFSEPMTPLARPVPTGVAPVELAIARLSDGGDARVACARVRFAPVEQRAVRWEAARFEGDDTRDVGYGVDAGMGCFFDAAARGPCDEAISEAWLATATANGVDSWTWLEASVGPANVLMFSSGWGDGCYVSYWGFDAHDRVVELVTDFDVLLAPVYVRLELPLPLARGRIEHTMFAERGIEVSVPLLSRRTVHVRGPGGVRVSLSDGSPVETRRDRITSRHTWNKPAPGVRLILEVTSGHAPMPTL